MSNTKNIKQKVFDFESSLIEIVDNTSSTFAIVTKIAKLISETENDVFNAYLTKQLFGENNIKVVENKSILPLVYLELTAFDIARLGNAELYKMADIELNKLDVYGEIKEMKMFPVSADKEYVKYKCVITNFNEEQ